MNRTSSKGLPRAYVTAVETMCTTTGERFISILPKIIQMFTHAESADITLPWLSEYNNRAFVETGKSYNLKKPFGAFRGQMWLITDKVCMYE